MSCRQNTSIRILLSEGSSTNVREMITALGPCGYTLDICDANPYCLGRFSRYVHKIYHAPCSGTDPIGYLQRVIQLLKENRYDVLFPANEQAYLFSWAKDFLTPLTGLAVADFPAFIRLQTKSAFVQLLDEINLPHPVTSITHSYAELEKNSLNFQPPYFLKTSFGTASNGIWRVENQHTISKLKPELIQQFTRGGEILIQAAATGFFEQAHAIFDQGVLLALHCTRRLLEGEGGGAIIKTGVHRPLVREHFMKIGNQLNWHGSLSIDYFWNEGNQAPAYIDANPRITEPVNALVNGINLADLQVRLSLGEKIKPFADGTPPYSTSHSTLQVILGAARHRYARRDVIFNLLSSLFNKGLFKNSRNGVTPISDLPSLIPLAGIILAVIIDPHKGQQLAYKAINNYSLGSIITQLPQLDRVLTRSARATALISCCAVGLIDLPVAHCLLFFFD